MIFVEENGIGAAKKLRPEMIAKPVAGVVACDGGYRKEGNEDLDPERAIHSREKSGGDEQRIPWQKESCQESRFSINDDHKDEIAAPADELLKIIKS